MDIQEIEKKIKNWKMNLSSDEKKYMHFHSMENFLFHYSEIDNHAKIKVSHLFENYIYEVEKAGFYFDKYKSLEIAKKYMNPIADLYSGVGYKLNVKLSFVVFWGILIDILLLISGVLSIIKYIPVTTLLLLIYFLYLHFFKKPKKLLYGLYY